MAQDNAVNIIDRISKLLNKANGAKEIGSIAEAEAFMKKVQELLLEHNLCMMEVEKHSTEKNKGGAKVVEDDVAD